MARAKSMDSKRAVGRIVGIGQALYVTLPKSVANNAGLKKGDRMAVETDGRAVIMAKIPYEDLINRALLRRDLATEE